MSAYEKPVDERDENTTRMRQERDHGYAHSIPRLHSHYEMMPLSERPRALRPPWATTHPPAA